MTDASSHTAKGNFDVELTPEDTGDAPHGRMRLDKSYHGDLQATAVGEMLTAMTETKGSAAYVAVEKVDGSLDGRDGTFMLAHHGLMTRGEPQLSVVVVPDSGTGELVGISGELDIQIVDGEHFYSLDYSLPEEIAETASP